GWLIVGLIVWWPLRRAKSEAARSRIAFAGLVVPAVIIFVSRSGVALAQHLGTNEARQLAYVARSVAVGEPVLQPWPNIAPFRPHPTYHWFDVDFIFQGKLRDEVEHEYIQAIEDRRVRDVFLEERLLDQDFPRLKTYLESNCRRIVDLPSSRHILYGYTCGR